MARRDLKGCDDIFDAIRRARIVRQPATIFHTFFLLLLLMPFPAMGGEVRLLAAASLTEVMNELTDAYAASRPRVRFVRSYAASGTLARQIEFGAPADIFISANRKWLDRLLQKGPVAKKYTALLARNSMVVVGRQKDGLRAMEDLRTCRRIAIGSPKSVPAGEYAAAALEKAGLFRPLLEQGRLIMALDVREALMYAERGEVDAAFVYGTDARTAKTSKVLFTVPESSHPQIVHPMVLTSDGAQNPEAVDFFRYLQSPSAREILARHHFLTRKPAGNRSDPNTNVH